MSGASPYFLASKIIQEVSRNGSGSTSGTYIAKDGTNLSGYYNYYNISIFIYIFIICDNFKFINRNSLLYGIILCYEIF